MKINTIGLEVKNAKWDEVKLRQSKDSVVVIPLGAEAKEHGLHLPLNNDFIMAEHFKNRILQELNVIVYPTINYYYFPSFMEYAGSTSIGHEAAVAYLRDLILSIARNGPRKFYILNTGISTVKPLAEVQSLLKKNAILMEYSDIRKFDSVKLEQEGGTHADEGETSLMLHIAPEIVDIKRAKKDCSRDEGDLSPIKKTAGTTFSPTGAWGDPTQATAKKGKEIEAAYMRGFTSDIRSLMARES